MIPFLQSQETAIKQLLAECFVAAEQVLQALCDDASGRIHTELNEEAGRLRALQAVNHAVRDDEIAALGEQQQQLQQQLQSVTMRLEGCCVLIVQT